VFSRSAIPVSGIIVWACISPGNRTLPGSPFRRLTLDRPLPDAIPSGRTPDREAAISDHPCLKPQHFMRILVRALLPLGEGVLLDTFMGSGSTIAAADAVGYQSVGIEIDAQYFALAKKAIPQLSALYPTFQGETTELEADYAPAPPNGDQLALALADKTSHVLHSTKPRRAVQPLS
jgi:hypothetical protein